MRFDIISLFPEYFSGPFDESMLKQARKKGVLEIHHTDIRAFAPPPHRKVDDRPYGGGPGMVLMPDPVCAAIGSVKRSDSRVIYLSPQGTKLTAAKARELAAYSHLVLLCGHYEGVDQRAVDLEVDEEVSIGDFVLTNGCLAAIVLVDAVARFVPGVLGHEEAADHDSFEGGLLDCPHYTRPLSFRGVEVPSVLRSGDHGAVARWRREQALGRTRQRRPDLVGEEKES